MRFIVLFVLFVSVAYTKPLCHLTEYVSDVTVTYMGRNWDCDAGKVYDKLFSDLEERFCVREMSEVRLCQSLVFVISSYTKYRLVREFNCTSRKINLDKAYLICSML